MADKETRKIDNRFNVEWSYVKAKWNAIVQRVDIPPRPMYSVWEIKENSERKLIKQVPCSVMRITHNGVVYDSID